jgi:hypothetical protein
MRVIHEGNIHSYFYNLGVDEGCPLCEICGQRVMQRIEHHYPQEVFTDDDGTQHGVGAIVVWVNVHSALKGTAATFCEGETQFDLVPTQLGLFGDNAESEGAS